MRSTSCAEHSSKLVVIKGRGRRVLGAFSGGFFLARADGDEAAAGCLVGLGVLAGDPAGAEDGGSEDLVELVVMLGNGWGWVGVKGVRHGFVLRAERGCVAGRGFWFVRRE